MKGLKSYIVFVLLLASIGLNAQVDSTSTYPPVFNIGEHEELVIEYDNLLLQACDNDINVAYQSWMHMLASMESHANSIGYDILGVKMWLQVFWDEDGSIEHIAYFLKPNSRNIDTEELNWFLTSFIDSYILPVKADKKFNHYASASFPTHYTVESEDGVVDSNK